MKQTLALLTLLAAGGLSAPSYANNTYYKSFFCNHFNGCGGDQRWGLWEAQKAPAAEPAASPHVASAPEIDASQAGLALALLGSILAMSREKYRNRKR